jgi:hypothetical protein
MVPRVGSRDGRSVVAPMVERAGFEPAYACAGRFTVCRSLARNRQKCGPMYHLCIIGTLAEERPLCSSGQLRVLLRVGNQVAVNVNRELDVFVANPNLQPLQIDAVIEPV